MQEFKLKGKHVTQKVHEIIREGRARRIIIKKDERILMEIPLTLGIGGTIAAIYLLPTLAALAAIAALLTEVSVIIERDSEEISE